MRMRFVKYVLPARPIATSIILLFLYFEIYGATGGGSKYFRRDPYIQYITEKLVAGGPYIIISEKFVPGGPNWKWVPGGPNLMWHAYTYTVDTDKYRYVREYICELLGSIILSACLV